MKYKEHRHLGIYGIVIENNKILLIKKAAGPYTGKLDLPGGSMEFGESPEETLKREFLEETGLNILKQSLLDVATVVPIWENENDIYKVHHTAIFYTINKYENELSENIELSKQNNDSLGAKFFDINKLKENDMSLLAKHILKKVVDKI